VRRLVVLGLVLLGAALLASSCSSTTANLTPIAASPSVKYLSTPVQSGWLRSVSRKNGLVFVFETPAEFKASGRWPYRFVLFNERGRSATWSHLDFGMELHAKGMQWLAARIGGRSLHYAVGPPQPPVTLRSGESTIYPTWTNIQEPPHRYQVVGFVDIDPGSPSPGQTPTLTVQSR
jgi:hypothetical protein